MRHSRRAILRAGIGLAGSSLLRPSQARAADLQFAADPFTLGIASGYPEPNAIVLWTRLAPEPLVPGGGVPAAPVEVAWEIGTDERLRDVARRGTAFATPDWAHSAARRSHGAQTGPRLLVPLHERRPTEPDRPYSHGRGTRHDAEPLHACSGLVPALRAKLLRGLSRDRGRRARSRRSRRRLHLREPRHATHAHARPARVLYARRLSRPLCALQDRSDISKPRTRPRRGCSSATITKSRTTTPASTRIRATRARCSSRGARPPIKPGTSTSRSRAGSCRSRGSSARTRAVASAISSRS